MLGCSSNLKKGWSIREATRPFCNRYDSSGYGPDSESDGLWQVLHGGYAAHKNHLFSQIGCPLLLSKVNRELYFGRLFWCEKHTIKIAVPQSSALGPVLCCMME